MTNVRVYKQGPTPSEEMMRQADEAAPCNGNLHPLPQEGGVLLETRKIRTAAQIGRATIPYTLEIPEKLSDPRVLILLNGFGGKKFGYDALRKWAAQNGKATANLNPNRSGGSLFHPDLDQSKAVWGVMRDIQSSHGKDPDLDVEQFDLAGHSMGGYTATILAKNKPQAVSSITFLESAGLEGGNQPTDFIPRAKEFVFGELIPAIRNDEMQFEKGRWHAVKSELDYILHNPLATIGEAMAVSRCDIGPDVKYLQSEHGIPMAAIVGTTDALIPAQRTIDQSWGLFEHNAILEGGHLLPMTQPQRVGSTIVGLVAQMNSPSPTAAAA